MSEEGKKGRLFLKCSLRTRLRKFLRTVLLVKRFGTTIPNRGKEAVFSGEEIFQKARNGPDRAEESEVRRYRASKSDFFFIE